VADTTPPVISALTPADGALLRNATVTISAAYSDNVAIDVSSVILKVDNVAVTPTKLTSSGVEYTTTLSDGAHTVSLTVKDTSGNAATATWSFTVSVPVPDKTPPVITILSPAKDSVVPSRSVTISAAYSDNVAIDVSSVILKVDNVAVTPTKLTSSGVEYTTTLSDGAHTVSLTVKDTSGNAATATWSFTVSVPIDYTPYIFGILILIIVVAAVVVLTSKRKR